MIVLNLNDLNLKKNLLVSNSIKIQMIQIEVCNECSSSGGMDQQKEICNGSK